MNTLRTISLMAISLIAGGCASNSSDNDSDSYIGWHCSGDSNRSNWDCQQRKMRNGKPVDDKVYNEKIAKPAVQQKVQQPTEQVVLVAPEEKNWRDQLPNLDASPAAIKSESGEGFAAEEATSRPVTRSARVPEPAFPQWNASVTRVEPATVTAAAEKQAVSPALDMNAESGPTETAGLAPAPTPALTPTLATPPTDEPGYTVQLGAFKDEQRLQQFLEEQQLNRLPLTSYLTQGDGQAWYVLVWGQFKGRDQAETAWADMAANYPGIESWVRPLGSLTQVSSEH